MKNYKVLADCRGEMEMDTITSILENRHIKDYEHFIHPVKADMLPLDDLENIEEAYEIISDTVEDGGKIIVYADVDTDGVTSGTIMTRYLRQCGANVEAVINQGKMHGLIGQKLDRLEDSDLIIIVDSLDKDISQYTCLSNMTSTSFPNKNKQVVVLDHHAINPEVDYDSVVTLVSSQRNYDNPNLSGAGVCWKFCKYYDEQELTDYADGLIDLAAIGLLADVMDVSETSYENRYIIYTGLNNRQSLAVKKILGSYEFNSKSVLFSISPLINACMRVGNNEDALNMFLSDDNKELLAYKKKLEGYKALQNEVVENSMQDIQQQIENQQNDSVVVIKIQSDYGISGLIGNKILDQVNRPLIILSWENDEDICGSMRSVGTKDFRSMINDTGLARADGHENAAGIAIQKSHYDEFLQIIRSKVDEIGLDFSEEIIIDAEINVEDATNFLLQKVHDLNFISGQGFKPITFKIDGFNSYSIGSWSKGKHLVMTYEDDCHTFIEWNTKCDWDEMDDHALMGDEIVGYGELEGGFVGKRYLIKCILNDYEIV